MGRSEKAARGVAPYAFAAMAAGIILSAGGAAHAQVSVQGQVGVGVQVGAQGYVQPPPVYQQPQPVYVQQQQPVYVQQPAVVYQQQPVYLAQPQIVSRRGNVQRFRYGFDAGAGWSFFGGDSGFNVTASLRMGVQLNDQWAVLYQTDLPISFVGRETTTSGGTRTTSSTGAAIVWGNAAMVEYTLNDIVSFSAGPSLDFAIAGNRGSDTDVGTFFGIQSRISLNLMPSNNYRRGGFRVGVGGHTTITPGFVVQSLSLHLGWELM